MISLAFGGFTNGSVPDSATTAIDGAGHRLEHAAAVQWLAMRQACFDATGRWINPAPGSDSAGRTLAQQEAEWEAYQHGGNTAAVPGESNHGWWRAIDITGYETDTSHWAGNEYINDGPVWKWLMVNMGRFGFSWATGQESRESWHFESYNQPSALAGGNASPIAEEVPDVKNKYQYSDRRARALNPGAAAYLSDANGHAINVIAAVGDNYSITPHFMPTGFAPGDSVTLQLEWQNKGVGSWHYPVVGVAGQDGTIALSPEFKRGAKSGDSVFVYVKAATTNKKTGTIVLIDSDAYLFS